MSKHTAGEWRWKDYASGDYRIIVTDEHRKQAIAVVHDVFGDGLANSRLIAAAPLLLEALRELHAVMHFDCRLGAHETLVEVSRLDFNAAAEKAIAAIRTATGEVQGHG